MIEVLAIEDDQDVGESLEDYLPDLGISVTVVSSAEEALVLAQSAKPDAILCDVKLPGMDGFEACRRFKKISELASIPVIFTTARTEVEDKLIGYKAGGVDYLTKPYKLEEIQVRVQYHVTKAQMERDLRRTNELLRLETERLERVLSITAHDLGGPLEGMGLVLGMLLRDRESKSRDVLDKLNDTVVSMKQTLHELLVWAKTGSIGPPIIETVQADSLIERNIAIVASMAAVKKINVSSTVGPGVCVLADRNMLDVIIRNLVINAVKFTSATGVVVVSSRTDNNKVVITVSDNGVGISESAQQVLFGSERRTTEGTVGESGSGLGLSLSYDLVALMNGEIFVESVPDKGSKFHVLLQKA